ncbi:MAG: hypothetical protein RLZZ598_1009 [Pseudomonadota bacterium]
MRLLLVRLGAFGDIVHTLPLAADLAAAGHRVHWAVEDRWRVLLDGNPAVHAVHALPRKRLRSGPPTARLRAWLGFVADLRRAQVDAAIDAQGLAKSALVALASAAPLRLGHSLARAREGAWLVTHRRAEATAEHVIDQQRALAELVGAQRPGPWRFPLPAWADDRAAAMAWLGERRFDRPWLLNVGAGWPTKVWPVECHAELLRRLAARGERAVLAWGSAAERELAERARAEAGYGEILPPTTIPELAGFIAAARIMVSGDTGPLHLALALGTPAVGLFGPVPATRNGPRGAGYRTLQAAGAAWERRDVSKASVAAITAGQVVDAADAACADFGRA